MKGRAGIPASDWLVLALVMSLAACVSQPPILVIPHRDPLVSELRKWNHPGPAINVSIEVFDPGATGPGPDREMTGALRKAESMYLPVLLQDALMESGGWGSVRVLPDEDPAAELQIQGMILESNGIETALRLIARDATGKVWLDRVYHDYATDHGYLGEWDYRVDPFEDLYHQAANDLGGLRAELTSAELDRILDVANLRYATALAPTAFSGYLVAGERGLVQLSGLPARGDAMFRRVQRIRESEYGFIDTVDAAYERFYHEVGKTYTYWRAYSYELLLGNETLAVDSAEKKRPRSWAVLDQVYEVYRDSKLNGDALRQMTESFDAEVTPTSAGIEGAVIELDGSLNEKYGEWRRILRELYAEERSVSPAGAGVVE